MEQYEVQIANITVKLFRTLLCLLVEVFIDLWFILRKEVKRVSVWGGRGRR